MLLTFLRWEFPVLTLHFYKSLLFTTIALIIHINQETCYIFKNLYTYVSSLLSLKVLFKPGVHGLQACMAFRHMQPSAMHAWFLEIVLFACWYVCLSVCLLLRALITKGVIWCGISHVRLVKPFLQLFRILPLINLKGVALVTQCIMYTRQRCQS